ncbi:hypothetical protein [Pantoea sp. 18069]|uniref:phage head spike fiber domain-containing protein n=1 Tax=Pantoea sp. 18069 TaxID=2681415 RepID=UPI001F3F1CD8|nr:hypothetical protein [Pantoea sp. 18069]
MPTSTVGTTTGKMQANGAIQITSGVLAPDGSSNGFTVVGALSSGNSTGNSNIRSLAGFGVAGVYTVSCWAKSSIAGTALLVRDPSSGAIIATPSLPPVWRKYYFTFTTTVDNANAIFYNTEGNAVDLFNVQIEAGPVASSDIPTTTAAVTRAADNPVIGIQPSLKKTFIAEVNSYAGYPSASANDRRHVFSLTPETLSTSSEYIWVFLASNGLFLVGRSPDGGIFTRTLLSAFPASNASHRVGVVIDGSTFQGVLNGVFGPVQTGLMNSGNVLNTLTIGAQQSSGVSRFVLGYVARLSIYESDLPIAQVQRLTQP